MKILVLSFFLQHTLPYFFQVQKVIAEPRKLLDNDEINYITGSDVIKGKELGYSSNQVTSINNKRNVFSNYTNGRYDPAFQMTAANIFGSSYENLFDNKNLDRNSNIYKLRRSSIEENKHMSNKKGLASFNDFIDPIGLTNSNFLRPGTGNIRSSRNFNINDYKSRRKRNYLKKKFSVYKRSDIDDDQELLNTIEKLEPEITVSSFEPTPKPLSGYMQNLAHDVRSVIGEAKNVLRHTGKVVHGLKRVISGATVLTSFTDNAIKFAKYFSIDPNNATIDYLEEKAIVAVLEAQKAATEAKEAADMAKTASKKAKIAARRIIAAGKKNKNLQNMIKYVHASVNQALLADKAANVAYHDKEKTEKDVMLMDTELKNLRSQLEKIEETPKKELFLRSQHLIINETNHETNYKLHNNVDSVGKAEIKTFSDNKEKKDSSYEYFLLKQKEMENKVKHNNRKSLLFNSPTRTIYNQTNIVSNIVSDNTFSKKQIEYILNLNQQISAMTKEKNNSLTNLKKSLPASRFEAAKTKSILNSLNNHLNAALKSSLNVTKLAKYDNKIKYEKNKHLAQNIRNIKRKFEGIATFLETPERSVVPMFLQKKYLARSFKHAKKGDIKHRNRLLVHLLPGEYTGFKKDEIAPQKNFVHENKLYNVFIKNESTAVNEGFDQLVNGRVFEDENSVIADDFDQIKKRNQLLQESKLIDNNLLHLADMEADFASASGSGHMPDPVFNKPNVAKNNFSVMRKIKKGPVTVTVLVHHNIIPKYDSFHSKSLDVLDPFGFKRIGETNEGGIVDRRQIPRPNEIDINNNFIKKNNRGTIWS